MSEARITVTVAGGHSTRLTLSSLGERGIPGAGFPAGGTTGQVLKKLSDANYDTEWSSVLVGATRIEVVDVVPDPQVTGVLYLSKT